MKKPLCLGLVTLALGFGAGPALAQTQMEMNTTAHNEAMDADARLNKAYKRVTAALNARHRDLLVRAELKWIKYRDAECDFEEDKYRGGSLQPLIYWNTYDRMTEARLKQLNASQPGVGAPTDDNTLNEVYQKLVEGRDAYGLKLLQAAELAWLAFRDAECGYLGTHFRAPRPKVLAGLTAARSGELAAELKDEQGH